MTANIAEGYGRYYYQEYTQYCRQGRGSLYEVIDHLTVAEEEQYITKEELNEYKLEIAKCLAVLNGFINYLAKAKASNAVNEPESYYSNTNNSVHPINH